MTVKTIEYRFDFENHSDFTYQVQLEDETLQYVPNTSVPQSNWTNLSYHQCSNCPLSQNEHAQCPIAANLNEVVQLTKNQISYEPALVTVSTKERTYSKATSLQEGLFSLFGIIMATSGCPHFDWLKPMARFHLPFANFQETIFRTSAAYALRQFLLKKKGQPCSFDIQDVSKMYEDIKIVNKCMVERINSFARGDADVNAIVLLDTLAQMFLYEDEKDNLDSLFSFFPELKQAS